MAVNFLTLRSAVANDMAVQTLTYSTIIGHPTASQQAVQAITASSIMTMSHVGIGTTAPVAGTALNVVGSTMISGNVSIVGGATGDALTVNNSKTGNDNNTSLVLQNNIAPTPSQLRFILKAAGPGAYHTLVQTGDHLLLSFDQNNGVAGANGIVIGGWNQTAGLRIGTTSSVFNGDLTIQGSNFYKYGTTAGYYTTIIGGSATNSPYMEYFANSLRRLYIGFCNTTDAFIQGENGVQLNLGTNGTTRLYLDTNGNAIMPSRECIVNQINGPGQFRAISGNYGFFIRNDGSNTYFLLTASGDQYGQWNTLRPLRIAHTTGLVTMENGLTVSGAVSFIPYGSIIMWYSSIASIPAGWALCNGSNGTPDLRDRFVVGAGYSYSPGNTGGESYHTLSWNEMPSHTHSTYCWDAEGVGYSYNRYGNGTYFGAQLYRREQNQNGAVEDWNALYDAATGSAGSNWGHENRPPYYALCYIMRII